jgi:hypothetical protein
VRKRTFPGLPELYPSVGLPGRHEARRARASRAKISGANARPADEPAAVSPAATQVRDGEDSEVPSGGDLVSEVAILRSIACSDLVIPTGDYKCQHHNSHEQYRSQTPFFGKLTPQKIGRYASKHWKGTGEYLMGRHDRTAPVDYKCAYDTDHEGQE